MKPKSMVAMLSLISEQKSHDILSTAPLPVIDVQEKDTAPVSFSLAECNDGESGTTLFNKSSIVPAVLTNLKRAVDTSPALHEIATGTQIEFSFDNNSDDSDDFFLQEITRIENEALRAKQVGILSE